MNTQSNAIAATRPLYWSVQRELWENRSIYLAPLIAAGVFLFAFLISTTHLPHSMTTVMALDAAHQRAEISKPFNIAAGVILLSSFLVGIFYCLDALHGERRDRSILFWKSLPVSDLTAVLAKAAIPLAVLPPLVFAIIFATQLIMLLVSSAVLGMTGVSTHALWTQVRFAESSLALLYCLVAMTLWHAPLYGWLLLVSGWAQRNAFLWAFLPPLGICILEKIAFNSSHFAQLLGYRFMGFFTVIFSAQTSMPLHPLAALTPGRFLATPGLWIGLVVAALFLAAAARMRRYRGPI